MVAINKQILARFLIGTLIAQSCITQPNLERDTMNERELSYQNKQAGITLAATLTLPNGKGPFPAVMLISGMGPTDRNGTFGNRKPLLDLADHLSKKGIAVLRADKRGIGKSTGTFDFSVTSADLAADVLAGIEFLTACPEIDHQKIGLIGMSEGGFIASIVAAESKDIAFVVLMSGAIANSIDDLVKQSEAQLQFDGASAELIKKDGLLRRQVLELVARNGDIAQTAMQLRNMLTHYWNQLTDAQKEEAAHFLFAFSEAKFDGFIGMYNSPWYRFYVTHDAVDLLAMVKVPLLAINGSLDFMVPQLVFNTINKAMALAHNKDYTTIELPNLNHAFQRCKTGALAEYETAEQTIAPEALEIVSDWVSGHTRNR